ncbi:hypothetical protein IJT17_09855 [bacterium]|nr:hypothetical protein [bacterium]
MKIARIAPLQYHNSERRRHIILRLQQEAPLTPDTPWSSWLLNRRTVLQTIRQELRRDLHSLLSRDFSGYDANAEAESEWPGWKAETLFAEPIKHLPWKQMLTTAQREHLAELALNLLDIAGRQEELERLIEGFSNATHIPEQKG